MRRLLHLVLVSVAGVACARTTPPLTNVAPVPATDSVASGPSPVMVAAEPEPPLLTDAALDSIRAEVDVAELADGPVDAADLAVAADATAAGPVTWDIDVDSFRENDRVEFYIKRYTGEAKDRIASWFQRGKRYEPMIRKTFREHGIPEDMYYLGLVESGYDPHAYSRAAAVGMWQFMASTAKGVGLRVDWWIDERRDPVRSTWGAARFLSYLRDQFGSLYLAAAAYNGGPGRISRSLNRYSHRVSDAESDEAFFELAETRALRAETRNYVPQLIAAAAVGKEPHRYGLELSDVPPFAYDSVRVPPATPVAAVAKAADVSVAAMRDLNPHLLRGVTSINEASWIRVPVGRTEGFDSAFAALPDSVRTPWKRVTIKRGASVAWMAKTNDLTTKELRWYNPRLRGSNIPVGTTVLVPTRAVVDAAFDVPDPTLERYGSAVNGFHVVRRGETLSHIAVRNHTTVQRLMQLNRLKKTTIFPGQRIRVR